ncbi:MAG: hypothetical protein II272_04550 [Oscillospiraceae bacterium]|nr:hypothetical protein [Oscillospiraceae bacterium]
MKKILILLLLSLLLLTACGKTKPPVSTEPKSEASTTVPTADPIPPMLIGMWRSLDPGELDMVETIEFHEDGSMTVSCLYQGQDAGTIYGQFTVSGDFLHCDMTANGEPYILDYRFEIDGRELHLMNDSKTADYIKVS